MGVLSFVMRYTSFVAGCLIMLGVGAGYSFGAYSQKLALMLNYTQSEINLAPSLGGIGTYIGAIVNGVLMDHFGTLLTSLFSGVFLFGGWALLYAGSLELVGHKPAILGIYYAIQQFGSQGGFYAALVGNLGNFKLKHRGTVTGILVSMYGLSAFLVSQLYAHVFDSYPPTLFLFMAFFTLALCLMGACALRVVKPYSSKGTINQKLVAVLGTDHWSGSESTQSIFSDSEDSSLSASPIGSSPASPFAPATPPPDHSKDLPTLSAQDSQPTNVPRYGQRKFFSLLRHPDFWCLAVTSFLTAGSGITFITIVGSVAQSWRLTEAPYNWQASTFTSVLSISNCLGRIIYGVCQDALRKHVRNVTFLLPIALTIGIAHFMMIWWMSVPSLMLGAILTGLSYGGFFATINVIINKYYGDENYSSNLGWNTLIIGVSGLIWGQVAGKLYDHFADPKTKHCYGPNCYRYTFMITTTLCVISLFVVLFIIWRERRDDRKKREREEVTTPFIN
jgi:MFS family permease